MATVSVRKNTTMTVPFENGQRNGGGYISHATSPGEVKIYKDHANVLILDKLEHAESLYAALGAIINAIKNET